MKPGPLLQPRHAPGTGEPAAIAPVAHHQLSLYACRSSRNVAAPELAQRQTDLRFKAITVDPLGPKARATPEQHIEPVSDIAQSQALPAGLARGRRGAAGVADLNKQLAARAPHVDVDR